MKHLFLSLFFGIVFLVPASATIWYVKTSGNDNNTGGSWATAFQNVQRAIDMASTGDEVWVASGTYLPTTTRAGSNPRDKTFYIWQDLKIFGGFPAAGGQWNERNWTTNPTVLSGDLGMQGNPSDNVYHVVWIDNRSIDMWLDGFTVKNGNANGSWPENKGGGIYNHADFAGTSTPTIQHCKILNNDAAVLGGGLYNDGSEGGYVPMELIDCVFSGNTALLGGGMYNDGSQGGTASSVLTDCAFLGNTATYGGGMYNLSDNNGYASPVLKECTFSANSVATNEPDERTGGGAVFNDAGFNSESAPSFTNCTFLNNSANGYKGGAIYSESFGGTASSSLSKCTFSGNTAAKGGSLYCFSEGGVASAGGDNCTFSGNAATLGGVAFSLTSAGGAINMGFTNSLFFNNNATERGAVLAFEDAHAGNTAFYNCTFSNNIAPQGGVIGVLSWNNEHRVPRLFNCIAWGNSSTFSQTADGQGNLDILYSLIQEPACPTGATCGAEVIYNQDPRFVNAAAHDFHLLNASPAKNSANAYALPIDFDGDARPQGPGVDMGYDEILFTCPTGPVVYVDKDATAGANNGTSWANAYTCLQDALDAASCANVQEIWVAEGTYLPTTLYNGGTERNKTFFIGFNVKIFGGFSGIETQRSQRNWTTHPTILSGDIGVPDDLSDNAYHVVWIEGRSSAMELDGFTITKGKLHHNNEIDSWGAGIYNNADHQASTPTIRNCTITANEGNTNSRGAGMFNKGYFGNASATITDCVFSNNTAPGNSDAAGLYNYAFGPGGVSSPVLTNCAFNNNYAAFRGGAIYNRVENSGLSAPVLTSCSFTGNTANAQVGGAIYHIGQTLILNNCTFTNNTAFIAGGVYIIGAVNATDCTFSGNTSPYVGAGALAINGDNTTSTLTNCTFSNNSAGTNGGAVTMYSDFNSTLTAIFQRCTFSGNSATNGGAVYTEGNMMSGLFLTMRNCLLFNNNASERGGAICAGTNPGLGAPTLYNCTLFNNTAGISGGAVGSSGFASGQASSLLESCIAWNNSSTFGQTAEGQDNITIQYSLIQEAACPTGANCSANVFNKDPLFVNVAANNFHLQACSPAINVAFNSTGTDFDGTARPQNGGYDMGAFEYQGAICMPPFNISGRIIWKQDNSSGVKDATVLLSGGQTNSANTATNGTYSLTVTAGTNFTLTPSKNLNKINGVNASDVLRINQHLSGNLLTDPWLLAAADVNGNNMVSSLDANIIQLSLLGNPSALAQFASSWRFVPTTHVMNNPPWGFPEKITLTGVNGNQANKDFYSFKVGDVTATYANPANFSTAKALVFQAPDQLLEAGNELSVEVGAGALSDLAAFQFALRFDPAQLQWVDVQPLGALPLSADNFGTFEAAEGKLRCVWAGAQAARLGEAAPVFRLTFKVLAGGQWLSEVLGLDEANLPGRAYNGQLAEAAVQLRYLEQTSAVDLGGATLQVALQQNQPNPFIDQTTIGFVLPEACTAQLRIVDGAGKVLVEKTGTYPAGLNRETFQLVGLSGVLYYELATPWGRLVRKMVGVQ